MPRPEYKASERRRIPEKIGECDFFLRQMNQAIGANGQPNDPFLFYFSAFLSAYRTLLYRAVGIVRSELGPIEAKLFWDKVLADRGMAALKNIADFEVHGDGITVYRRIPFGADPNDFFLYPQTLARQCGVALENLKYEVRQALKLP
jgi:hypothetical protein